MRKVPLVLEEAHAVQANEEGNDNNLVSYNHHAPIK